MKADLVSFDALGVFEVHDESLLEEVAGGWSFGVSWGGTDSACGYQANNQCKSSVNSECITSVDTYCGNINCSGPATGAVVLTVNVPV